MNYRVLTKTSAGSRFASALDGPFPQEFGLHGCQTSHARPPSALFSTSSGRMTQMFWELVLAALAGWTVLPALVWALANEIMRLI